MSDDGNYLDALEAGAVAPGKMHCLSLGGREVLIANAGGTLHAVDAMCTHEEASLCDGALREHRVSCPLHGSRFDLRTGEALEDPADQALVVHRVRVHGGRIQVRLAAQPSRS